MVSTFTASLKVAATRMVSPMRRCRRRPGPRRSPLLLSMEILAPPAASHLMLRVVGQPHMPQAGSRLRGC